MSTFTVESSETCIGSLNLNCELEICVDNIKSALIASENGATRLELCSSLLLGGVTPGLGLLRRVKELVDVPVFVLIRHKSGDFTCSKDDIKAMEYDILASKEMGADGLVLGALKSDYTVDEEACEKLLKVAHETPVTFHRAFDYTRNAADSLEKIIELGFSRVLTSGHEPKAVEGLLEIQTLIKQANSRIIIMPGGGISADNIKEIMLYTKAKEFHSSAQTRSDPAVPPCHDSDGHKNIVSDLDKVPMADPFQVEKMALLLKALKPLV